MQFLFLVLGLIIILIGAEFFTNGIEWVGEKLCLSEGAVGSVLAAVGTALPETMIPVIAILFRGGKTSHEIGIGAILGAPFMLGTLAFFITGMAALIYKVEGKRRDALLICRETVARDLGFFLIIFTIALLSAMLPARWMKIVVALLLVASYIVYAYRTFCGGKALSCANLHPLYCARKVANPHTGLVVLQVVGALAAIVIGANFFVGSIDWLADKFAFNPLVLSLIITPVATELPEKFNSIIWIRQGKDTLAMGNLTGAMVFQSSLIPALGIVLTSWELSYQAAASAILALLSAGLVWVLLRWKGQLKPLYLLPGGAFYLVFLGLVLWGR